MVWVLLGQRCGHINRQKAIQTHQLAILSGVEFREYRSAIPLLVLTLSCKHRFTEEKSHADFADEADKTICRNRQNLHEIVFLRVSEDR